MARGLDSSSKSVGQAKVPTPDARQKRSQGGKKRGLRCWTTAFAGFAVAKSGWWEGAEKENQSWFVHGLQQKHGQTLGRVKRRGTVGRLLGDRRAKVGRPRPCGIARRVPRNGPSDKQLTRATGRTRSIEPAPGLVPHCGRVQLRPNQAVAANCQESGATPDTDFRANPLKPTPTAGGYRPNWLLWTGQCRRKGAISRRLGREIHRL